MKKVFTVIGLVFLSAMIFAQTADYNTLLNRAKVYQGQKELPYALGYYYDAMESSLEDCDEAYQGWLKIVDVLKKGKPGFEDYNAFQFSSEWQKLLQNAEKYWNEFPYWGVEIEQIVPGDPDPETGKPSCIARVRLYETEKNRAIRDLILKGLNFDNKDYEIEKDEQGNYWPEKSLFAEKNMDIRRVMTLKLAICDKDGKVLLEGANFVLDSTKKKKVEAKNEVLYYDYRAYPWRDVDADTMNLIKSGEYEIKPTGFSVENMVFNESGEKDAKKSVKINFSIDKSEFLVKGKKAKESVITIVEKRKAEDEKRMERHKKYLAGFGLTDKEQLITKIVEDNKMTKEFTGALGSNYIETLCNTLSEILGYSNAYTPDSEALVEGSNGIYCKFNNDSEEHCLGGQALQPKKLYYLHSLDPELEAKIQETLNRKKEELVQLLEARKPLVNVEILKFVAKNKATKEVVLKKFQNDLYDQKYIEDRIAELFDDNFIGKDKSGKFILTQEGKKQIQ